MPASYRPSTAHRDLGDGFFDPVEPARFPRHILRYRNRRWAKHVGLGELSDAEWCDHFGRFEPLPDNHPHPLALRYHGHQFQIYNPDLGDGRGFLFGQLYDGRGRLLDLATKGSGTTPYSRMGDGRLTLKGGVREVLATAMLEAQGVYTSKSFSLVETGEDLDRQDEPSPTRGSVLVRLSHGHIRIGSFQRLLAENDAPRVARLVRHAITYYLPEATPSDDDAEEAEAFLTAVARRVARLCAQWTAAGFVHGVLNTDNINITGESFDYGPYRFLPTYQPGFTAAYFDHYGLYAFGRQPGILQWNLQRLADCLLLVAPRERLERALAVYEPSFFEALRASIFRRLGLARQNLTSDEAVVKALIRFLHRSQAPFEQVFFDLAGGSARAGRLAHSPAAANYAGEAYEALAATLASYEPEGSIDFDHAYFQRPGPETLLYDEIEALWAPIVGEDDWSPFEAKLAAIEGMRQAYRYAGDEEPRISAISVG